MPPLDINILLILNEENASKNNNWLGLILSFAFTRIIYGWNFLICVKLSYNARHDVYIVQFSEDSTEEWSCEGRNVVLVTP